MNNKSNDQHPHPLTGTTVRKANDWLKRRICPGCGTEGPESKSDEYFSCSKCEWESDDGLPTIIGIMRGKFTNCSNVNLTEFLISLMRTSAPRSQTPTRCAEDARRHATKIR